MIVFGRKCFEYVLDHAPLQISEVYLSKEIDKRLFSKIRSLKRPIIRIDNKKAQSLAFGGNHQGMLLSMPDICLQSIESMLDFNRLVILCNVSDIGNIGSIVRTCYALGIDGIVLCDRANVTNSAMSGIFRASSGALLHMPLCLYHSSLDIINLLRMRSFSLLGSDINGAGVLSNTSNKWALFMGQEDIGLTRRILDKMDSILHIEMNGFNSLNVSVATGILIDRINNMQKGGNDRF